MAVSDLRVAGLKICNIELYRIDLETRFPFRYGIAEMTRLPHVFLRLTVETDGKRTMGVAADHLPPKWFKKDPQQAPEDEIAEMLTVIQRAAEQAVGATAPSAFEWWREAYAEQLQWAKAQALPPLLAHFGVSLVERALIEALARAAETPFHSYLLGGGLGFDPAAVHDELKGMNWQQAFPAHPLERIALRHTVGLGDPLESSDIAAVDRLDDGLPQALEEAVRAYGLTHFKVKLSGKLEKDCERLARLHQCLDHNVSGRYYFTLDGNEQYASMENFARDWEGLAPHAVPEHGRGELLFIEQPVQRDKALDPVEGAADQLPAGADVIIDESDATIESLPAALELGYAGTSHKNCKGVFKGLANHCLLSFRQQRNPERRLILSGEDLANIGPVALLQDLAVQASMGIRHVERNGHHYFRGLSAFPQEVNEALVRRHPDLYVWHAQGFASLRIEQGEITTASLQETAFGPGQTMDLAFAEQIF